MAALNKVAALLLKAVNAVSGDKEAVWKTDDGRHAVHTHDQHDQALTAAQLTAQGLATEATLATLAAAILPDDHSVQVSNEVEVTLNGETIALDAATLAALETITANQGTSPWVVSGTVTSTPSGTQDVNIVSGIELEVTLNGEAVSIDNFPSEYPLPADQLATLTPVSGPAPLDQDNSTKTPLSPGAFTAFTVDDATDIFTSAGHGLSNGDVIVVTSDDTLPDGMVEDQVYYVSDVTTDTFKLKTNLTAFGAYIDATDTGTGTHSWAVPGEFAGPWTQLDRAADLFMFGFSNVPLGRFEVQWSSDGVTQNTDLLSTSNIKTTENTDTPGFAIYLDTLTTSIDNYYRVVVNSGSSAAFFTDVRTWVYPGGFHGTFLGLSDALGDLSTALLTRAVQAGVTPYGDFVNRPEGGEAYRYATNKVDEDGLPDPDAPLLADEEIVTPWISTQGHVSMEIFSTSDVESAPDGIKVEYSPDPRIPESEQFTTPDFFEFRGASFASGRINTVLRPRRSYVRVTYKNNDTTDQTRFSFVIGLSPASRELPRTALDAELNVQSEALTTKGGLVAADDAKSILPIGRDGQGGSALNVHLKAIQEALEFTLGATTKMVSGQIALSDAAEQQVPLPVGITRPKTLRMTHPGGEGFPSIYFRSNAQTPVTSLNGDFILPSTSVEIDINDAEGGVQVILGTPDDPIATEQDDLVADTVDSNTGVLNPSNMYAGDSTYAVFDAANDTATISGFDATGQISLTNIDSVVLRGIARKEPGAPGEVMAYSDPVTGSPSLISSGSTAGGQAITSPTLLLNTSLTYFLIIARENTGAALTNVTNTMGFSGYTVEREVSNGGESRHSVVRMTGTPTSTGTISAFLSAASSHDCITVVACTNAGATQASNQFTTTSGGSFSVPNTAGTANGLAIAVVAAELANVNTPVTNFTTREQGGSAANDDQTLWVGTRTLPSTTNYTLSGTTDGGTNDDITASLITIMPSAAADPVVEVSVFADGGTLPVTMPMVLTSETNQAFELDISDQVVWTKAILDAATVTPLATLVGNADAQIDQLYLDVDASSNAIRMGYTWVGD